MAPNPALVGETVTFDGTGSTGDGGTEPSTIALYEWELDGLDDDFDEATGPIASTSYTGHGTITVGLRVTDSDTPGDVDTETVSLKIHRAPTAGFIFEPSTPAVGEQITFSSTSSDPDGPIASYGWELDDLDDDFNEATSPTATHTFLSAGTHPVKLRITDADGATATVSRDVFVQNNPPSAAFTFSPPSPQSGATVSFDGSGSTPPPSATITGKTWDLDGDGSFDDATGDTPSFSYPTPGPRTVGLRVDASNGTFDVASQVVQIANRAPTVSFHYFPRQPRAGDEVELTSTSFDPDGPIVAQDWDLDDDGAFDDASGALAKTSFPSAGSFDVGLRVRDSDGATSQGEVSVDVKARKLAPMSPFPVVRLTGELRPNGNTLIERLTVTTPKQTEVAVRCGGKRCPFKEIERTARLHRVKFPQLAKNPLAPGHVIKVFVTDPDLVGKYTRFRLRNGKAPKRKDACLKGDVHDPSRCPG